MDWRWWALGSVCIQQKSVASRCDSVAGGLFGTLILIVYHSSAKKNWHQPMFQEDLKNRLIQKRAKETGICPVREETYAQAFGVWKLNPNLYTYEHMWKSHCLSFKANQLTLDELIRQCTVESPERGLLLLRVRDEMRIIVAAYQVLYESSLAYAVRKSLQAEVQRLDAQLLVRKETFLWTIYIFSSLTPDRRKSLSRTSATLNGNFRSCKREPKQ